MPNQAEAEAALLLAKLLPCPKGACILIAEHEGDCKPPEGAHVLTEPPRATAPALISFLSSIVETGGRVELDAGTGEHANALECAIFYRGVKPVTYIGRSSPAERAAYARAPKVANIRDAIDGAFLAVLQHRETVEREPRRQLTTEERRRAFTELLADWAVTNPTRELSRLTVEELASWAAERRGS